MDGGFHWVPCRTTAASKQPLKPTQDTLLGGDAQSRLVTIWNVFSNIKPCGHMLWEIDDVDIHLRFWPSSVVRVFHCTRLLSQFFNCEKIDIYCRDMSNRFDWYYLWQNFYPNFDNLSRWRSKYLQFQDRSVWNPSSWFIFRQSG